MVHESARSSAFDGLPDSGGVRAMRRRFGYGKGKGSGREANDGRPVLFQLGAFPKVKPGTVTTALPSQVTARLAFLKRPDPISFNSWWSDHPLRSRRLT